MNRGPVQRHGGRHVAELRGGVLDHADTVMFHLSDPDGFVEALAPGQP